MRLPDDAEAREHPAHHKENHAAESRQQQIGREPVGEAGDRFHLVPGPLDATEALNALTAPADPKCEALQQKVAAFLKRNAEA